MELDGSLGSGPGRPSLGSVDTEDREPRFRHPGGCGLSPPPQLISTELCLWASLPDPWASAEKQDPHHS